jgi:hypothetical protein
MTIQQIFAEAGYTELDGKDNRNYTVRTLNNLLREGFEFTVAPAGRVYIKANGFKWNIQIGHPHVGYTQFKASSVHAHQLLVASAKFMQKDAVRAKLAELNSDVHSERHVCAKCNGTGFIPQFAYYADGICFDCYGVGTSYKVYTAKPKAPAAPKPQPKPVDPALFKGGKYAGQRIRECTDWDYLQWYADAKNDDEAHAWLEANLSAHPYRRTKLRSWNDGYQLRQTQWMEADVLAQRKRSSDWEWELYQAAQSGTPVTLKLISNIDAHGHVKVLHEGQYVEGDEEWRWPLAIDVANSVYETQVKWHSYKGHTYGVLQGCGRTCKGKSLEVVLEWCEGSGMFRVTNVLQPVS